MTTETVDGLVTDRQASLVESGWAIFDATRAYRYLLGRQWSEGSPAVFIMLNPSTADAFASDPTVIRCIRFARREGCGGLLVLNLFALRSTDPRALIDHPDPVGPSNDEFLERHVGQAALVVVAWGTLGSLHGRAESVTGRLRARGVRLSCLGVTVGGNPRHPLYLRNDAPLRPYEADPA